MKKMKPTWILILLCSLFIGPSFLLPVSLAAIDVDMHLNDGGFVSFDHFLAELRLNNHDAAVPDAQIFGALDVYGTFFFWPGFSTDVQYNTLDIPEGDMTVNFLEFDFPDIDDFIPFGPMNFWGAWVVSGDEYGYDVQEFWLDSAHKWTPTPATTPGTPTFTPTPGGNPTSTPTPAGQWEPGTVPEEGIVLYKTQFIGDEGWIVGGTDKVYYTTDGGDSFTPQPLPANSGATTSIFMKNPSEGYTVTDSGKILRFSGGTWTNISSVGTGMWSVHFPPSGAGYCCGDGGEIYRIDGTTVTFDNPSPTTDTLTSIMFPVSSSEGWVCGGSTIRHRISSGWVIDQNYLAGDYASICFVNNTTGWVVGDSGRILHTTDGTTWGVQTNPDTNLRTLYCVFFLNGNEGWIVGNSLILHTTNGGTNWYVEGESVSSGRLLTGVYFTDSTRGYAVGENTFLRFR